MNTTHSITGTPSLSKLLSMKVDIRENRAALIVKKPMLSIALEKVDEDKIRYAVIDQHESLRCRYDEEWYVFFKHEEVTIISNEAPKLKRVGNFVNVHLRGINRDADAQVHLQQFRNRQTRDETFDTVLRALQAFAEAGYYPRGSKRGSKSVLVLKKSWPAESIHNFY